MKMKTVDGTRLKNLRKLSTVTQDEMAKQLGISRQTVMAIESNTPEALDDLSFEKVNQWGRVCRNRIARLKLQEWIGDLKKIFRVN